VHGGQGISALLLPGHLSAFIRAASRATPRFVPPAPTPAATGPPAEPLVPFTCPWAKDGLQRALDGLQASSGGVSGYKIGTRQVTYHGAGEQAKVVEYWQRMVNVYCRTEMAAMPGQDTAFRVVLRDV
jgi:hypothetical protein